MPRARLSRRDVLRGTSLGLAAAALGGCSGERLRTPWSPEPDQDGEAATSPPDSDLLEAALHRVTGHRLLLARVEPRSDGQQDRLALLDRLWSVQQDRLVSELTLSGVQVDAARTEALGDSAATSTSIDEDRTTSSPGLDLADLGDELRASLDGSMTEITRSTATHRPMLTSLAAQHALSAGLSGAAVAWPELAGPSGSAAVPVLGATRPAVFGLEVVAARSIGDERERYEAVLAPMRALNRSLTTLAGAAAPVPPLGYDLPEPLRTKSQRADLARALVSDLAPAALTVAHRAGDSAGQVAAIVQIVAEAASWARRLGADPEPFPGMTLP